MELSLRPMEITIVSAKGLKKVKDVPAMNVFVEAAISDNTYNFPAKRTPAAKDCGSSPTWNFQVQFTVDEIAARKHGLVLLLRVKCERPTGGDKDIGEARVPLKDLLDKSGKDRKPKKETVPVKKPSGKEKGELKFEFKFGDKVVGGATGYTPTLPLQVANFMPPAAYPGTVPNMPYGMPPPYQPPMREVVYAAPPPPQPVAPASYAPPGYPQPGYGYAPQGAYVGPGYRYGYAQPPQPQQQASSIDGLEVGAAFVGGMIGGMVLSDIATNSNAGAAYEAGYDAGYVDASGF